MPSANCLGNNNIEEVHYKEENRRIISFLHINRNLEWMMDVEFGDVPYESRSSDTALLSGLILLHAYIDFSLKK